MSKVRLKEGSTPEVLADTLALVSLKLAEVRASLKVRDIDVPEDVETSLIEAYAAVNSHFESTDGSQDIGVMLPWRK